MHSEILNSVPISEPLIASDRVEGTAIINRPNGETIGIIKRLMIDKKHGNIVYAVVGFGGIFGFGENHFPVPWSALTFDDKLNAYKIDLSEDQWKDIKNSFGQFSGDRSSNIYVDGHSMDSRL